MSQSIKTFDYTTKVALPNGGVFTVTKVTQTNINGNILPVVIPESSTNGTPVVLSIPSSLGFQPSTNGKPATTQPAKPGSPSSRTGSPASRSESSASSVTKTPSPASRSKPSTSGPTQSPNPSPTRNNLNNPKNSNEPSNSNNISSGAAAGIGVGCAIAGALIAAFIVWLLMRRSRRSRRPARTESVRLNGLTSAGKSGHGGMPSDVSSAAAVVERNLPQPADDQAISGEISRLRTLIKNHAQSYYHSNPARASATGIDQGALGAIAMGNMPIITSTLTTLLSSPSTRMSAIRFCIAWTAISRIDLGCEPGMRDDPQTHMAFISKWRTISAALLQRTYGSGSFSSSDPRNRNINNALEALNSLLRPYADGQHDDKERERKLEEIMRRAARFGFLLFSQPSTWNFDWETPQNAGRGALVIFPALLQIGDDTGKKSPMPRALEEQELVRGLEKYL
ncbi:MAG: hypothetical protein Q9167_008001 [Letrouitia subvulpina]